MSHAPDDLLAAASSDAAIAQRLAERVRGYLDGRVLSEIATAIAVASGGDEKVSSVTQRLVDLRSGRDTGRRWILSTAHPHRLAGLLAALGVDSALVATELERGGWHPAWPELGPSPGFVIDSVPGLRDGLDELTNRVAALTEGQRLLVTGPPGIGLSMLRARLQDRFPNVEGTPSRVIEEFPSKSAALELADRAKSEGRSAVVFFPTVASEPVGSPRPDIELEPWTAPEIAAMARALAATSCGRRLGEVPDETWMLLAESAAITPLEVGFVLRSIADTGPDAVRPRSLGPSIVEAISRARCPSIDPAIVRDAFIALCRLAYDASHGGRWPGELPRRAVEEAIERVGAGRDPVVTGRTARPAARAALATLREHVGKPKKGDDAALAALDTLERSLAPRSPRDVIEALGQAGLAGTFGRDGPIWLAPRIAALVTAATVDWAELADRAHEPPIREIALAAARGVDDPDVALRALLENGAGRVMLGLRVALALVARGSASDGFARAVVGSVVEVALSGRACLWLDASPAVVGDLQRASEKYSQSLDGVLPVLDAVQRWISLAPVDRFAPALSREVLVLWLPFQHRNDVLSAEHRFDVPVEIQEKVLRAELGEGDPRARRIVSGRDTDFLAQRLGRRWPLEERVAMLEADPPTDVRERLGIIETLIAVHKANDSTARRVYGNVFRELDAATLNELDIPWRRVSRSWIEALADVRARDSLVALWDRAREQIASALSDDGGHPAGPARQLHATIKRDGDVGHALLLAMSLARLDDLAPLRWLARLETGDGVPPVSGSLSDVSELRRRLALLALPELIRARDVDGLRALVSDDPSSSTFEELEARCRVDIDVAVWAADELDFKGAVMSVLQHIGEPRCKALAKRWASDHVRSSWVVDRAVEAILESRDELDDAVLAPWLGPEREAFHRIPAALRHPSARIQDLALEWLIGRADAALATTARDPRVLLGGDIESRFAPAIDRIVGALDPYMGRKRVREALHKLLVVYAPDGEQQDDPYRFSSALTLVERIARHDARLALQAIEDVERRVGTEAAKALARMWTLQVPDAPDVVYERAEQMWLLACRTAQRVDIDELSLLVRGLTDEDWVRRTEHAEKAGLARYPWDAIRALAERAPDRLAADAHRRLERLALDSRTADALALAEWIAEVDAVAGASALDELLGVPEAPGSGGGADLGDERRESAPLNSNRGAKRRVNTSKPGSSSGGKDRGGKGGER